MDRMSIAMASKICGDYSVFVFYLVDKQAEPDCGYIPILAPEFTEFVGILFSQQTGSGWFRIFNEHWSFYLSASFYQSQGKISQKLIKFRTALNVIFHRIHKHNFE